MEKNFSVNSKQLSCTLEGDPKNPAVFLIHDWLSHRGVWRQTISVLQTKYFCVAVDLLGFGASDKPESSDYSLSAQAQRVLSIADQLGINNFSLIGHSMGAQIAMYIASVLAPRRVDKLACIAGIVTGTFAERVEKVNVPFVRNARKWPWLFGTANALIGFSPFVNYIFKPWFFDLSSIPSKDWEANRLAAINLACAISADETAKAIHALDLSQHLRKIKAKTLLITGKQDGMVSMDQSLLAQTLIPDNDLALIEKCGHFPMIEKPTQYLKALGLMF